MADIGRFDVAHSLKQFFELTGAFQPAIGEGIVPTIELGDLERTPFAVSIPFVRRVSLGPTAAVFSQIHIVKGGSGRGWVTIDRILFAFAAPADVVMIEPTALGLLPVLAGGATSIAVRARQNTDVAEGIAEAEFRTGTSATGFGGDSTRWLAGVGGTAVIEGPWHFNELGALKVIAGIVNQAVDASFFGRVHLTTAR